MATGGSLLDPSIVEALVNPVTSAGDLSPAEEELLSFVAEGRPMKAIAATQGTTGEAVADDVERLFLKLAQAGQHGRQQLAAPAAHAPPGHRPAGGAGRDA